MMKRAISLLLMIVMVLAPCAVAHAVSLAPHHAASLHTKAGAPSSGDLHVAPYESHGQHAACVSGVPERGDNACSGDCETLQRVAKVSVAERTPIDMEVSFAAFVFALSVAVVAVAHDAVPDGQLRPVVSILDSKTVLRKTARLRL